MITEIEKLKAENEKLKKLVEFLENEVKSLEFKTALSEKAIPLKDIIAEITSTPEGKKAWEEAWKEYFDETRSCNNREERNGTV